MGTKFFTNQGQNTLLKKFEGIFKHTKVNNFDALVGYLRASGYFKISKYLKKVPKVRILVGINVDHVIKKFKKILENKRETIENKIPWHSLHWPRDKNLLESRKIVCPRRAKLNNFAFDYGGYF